MCIIKLKVQIILNLKIMIDSGPSLAETGVSIEPKLQPSEGKIGLTPEQNVFHQKIAEGLNIWKSDLATQGKDIRKEIYRPDKFEDDWSRVDPVDYICHRLSVIGLADSKGVSAEDISGMLSDYRDKVATVERVAFAQECYAQFNTAAQECGLDVGSFDPNRLYFLGGKRIAEIAGSSIDGLAYTLNGSVGEILIPADDAELNNDPSQQYDVIVHELGHQARGRKGLDRDKSTVLEEGIIQAQARLLELTHNKVSRRTNEVYSIEAQIAEQLATTLDVKSLFGLSHQEIRAKMREKYMLPGQVDDPYDDLVYDLITYRRKFDSFASRIDTTDQMTDVDIKKMQTELMQDRLAMNQKWTFKMK